MFRIFKRLRALEAENKSLNGVHHAVIEILTKIYVGKYAVQKTDPIFSFKIVEVNFTRNNIMIRGNNDLYYGWHNINEYKIQDENPKNLKKSDIFCESWQKQLDDLVFDIKVASTTTTKMLIKSVGELENDLDKLQKEIDSTKTIKVISSVGVDGLKVYVSTKFNVSVSCDDRYDKPISGLTFNDFKFLDHKKTPAVCLNFQEISSGNYEIIFYKELPETILLIKNGYDMSPIELNPPSKPKGKKK